MKKFEVIATVRFTNADVFGEGRAFGENAIEMKRQIILALSQYDVSVLAIKVKEVVTGGVRKMSQSKTAAQIVAEEQGIPVQEGTKFLANFLLKEDEGIYFETFDDTPTGNKILHTHTVATNLSVKMLLDKLGLKFVKEQGGLFLKDK